MTDDSVFLISGDVLWSHAGEKIVRMVVGADVIETEPPVFPFAQPPFRCAVGRRRLALRPLAGRALSAKPTILVGLDPDAIE